MGSVETAAVLITDLVGSTGLQTRMGPARADSLRGEHFELLRGPIGDTGGREVKNLGDGLMVAFGSASGATGCAVAMQQAIEARNRRADEQLAIRIGLSMGDVTFEDDDYFGLAVVEAARLCDRAVGGQILAKDVVAALAGGHHGQDFKPLGSLELKGLAEPVDAVEVSWEPAAPVSGTLELGLLLERDGELAALSRVLAAAGQGAGQLVVVEGPPGVGKSTLMTAAVDEARARDMRVLYARATDIERHVAFGVARRMFEPHLVSATPEEQAALLAGPAGLARPLFGDRRQQTRDVAADPDLGQALVEGLYWLAFNLCSADPDRPRPALIALDDAQWSDSSSLRFIVHAVMRLSALPVVVVVAMRPREQHSAEDLLTALRSAPAAQVLRPQALSEGAVERLARATFGAQPAPGFSLACLRATGGNPFLLNELLITLHVDDAAPTASTAAELEGVVPESVQRSVLARLAALPAEARSLASAVAVLGDGALLRHAATLAEVDDDRAELAADELAAAQILSAGEPLSFRHPLVASAVGSELAPFARARAHRRAATLLAEDGAPPTHAAVHLVHSRTAADPWVVETLRSAAARALAQGETGAAVRFLRRALSEPPTPEDRTDVLTELALAEGADGAPEGVERLAEALDRTEDHERRASVFASLARLVYMKGDFSGAAQAAQRGLAELQSSGPMADELLVTYFIAGTFDPVLRPEIARRMEPLVEEALAGRFPPQPALCARLSTRVAVVGGPPECVRALAERALRAVPQVVDADHGIAYGFALASLIYVEEPNLVARATEAEIERCAARGARIAVANLSHWRGSLELRVGRLKEAIAYGERALELQLDGWTNLLAWTAALLSEAHLERGEPEAARQALELADTADPANLEHAMVLHAAGRLALNAGDAARALELFTQAGHHLAELYRVSNPNVLAWESMASLAATQLGDGGLARELADGALARARESGLARPLGLALHAAGQAAGGDHQIELLGEALAALQRCRAPLEQARVMIDLGVALRLGGSPAAAGERFAAALELADRIGAAPLAALARDELRASGATVRRAAPSRPSTRAGGTQDDAALLHSTAAVNGAPAADGPRPGYRRVR